jgi:hypothetical protein
MEIYQFGSYATSLSFFLHLTGPAVMAVLESQARPPGYERFTTCCSDVKKYFHLFFTPP